MHPQWLDGSVSNMGIRYYSTPSLVLNKLVKEKKALQQMSQSTSLVVWGQNLTSTVGTGRFTKQVSEMIKLPPHQYSVIVGLILSDGLLRFASAKHKNARFEFKQSLAHSGYVWFVFNLLSHYCNSSPILTSGVTKGNRFYGLQFSTRALPCFNELYSLFYPNGVKLIPEDIYNILTPVALAHIIMGDGSTERHGLIICTDSYSVQDIVRLMNVLVIRYRLKCTLRYHTPTQPRIYISERSMPLLRTIVTPHMCSTMLYKLR